MMILIQIYRSWKMEMKLILWEIKLHCNVKQCVFIIGKIFRKLRCWYSNFIFVYLLHITPFLLEYFKTKDLYISLVQ